ncbi:MAG: flagellar basal body rod protein FlgC [Alphaproteobacteria bacterium]|nr:flagellar basal body rod protein FlgC [Alphaproteobacteria bacterium]
MASDLQTSMMISAAGMRSQGQRVKVIAENIANANSTANTPGGDPYRRQVVTFKSVFDRELNADIVRIDKIRPDNSEFNLVYDPVHPASGPNGYYKKPNVQSLVEMVDMREAQRSYEANVNMVDTARKMLMSTINLLR